MKKLVVTVIAVAALAGSVSAPAEARGLGGLRFHRGGAAVAIATAAAAAAVAADAYGYGYGYGPYYGPVYRYYGW
jgi:hypothetical protein